ncbi:MAG: lysylphosphatidylglycerol synthase transmembrane domain-containing protein, partial [Aggregatilineales bacterium]
NPPSQKRRWRILSLVVAVLLISYVLFLVDFAAFGVYLQQLSPGAMAAAFGVYVLLNFFRALRFIALLGDDVHIPLIEMFPVALAHNLLVRLLPFKTGELSYFVLLRGRGGFTVERGVSSLFGARFLELLMIVLVVQCAALFSGQVVTGEMSLIIIAGLSTIGGILCLYFAANIIRIVIKAIERIAGRYAFLQKLVQGLNKLAISFEALQNPRRFGMALFWSIFTYVCSFSVNWILLSGIGADIEFTTLVLIISLGMFATAIPFNVSGFGAVELSWAFSLSTFLSYTTGEATSIGLMLNGFQLGAAALSGIMGYVFLRLWRFYHTGDE